ncbi:uncharacterized protein LOC114319671 isoform X1 [Camellia sinensis]|uniref:uncharacterized protein LOC114319671 isoform X1 n=1 Tax=Camellia sinensis TaxID=4442 RepID=UPI001036F0F8|nr:uncharacterized protein LOC114319671 isoform X1 [Camellia sinensis]
MAEEEDVPDRNLWFFVAVHVGEGFHAPSNEKALRSAMKRACLAAASVLRKDPATGKMIGHAELKDGLYFSEADLVKKSQESQGLVSTTFQQKDDQVWLWHRRVLVGV